MTKPHPASFATTFAVPALPGHTFVRRIGQGATSELLLYRDRRTARVVAVKHSHAILDSAAAERFRVEAACLRRLSSHPNILTMHGAGVTDDGRGYLMLAYAEHGSCKELVWPKHGRCRPLAADRTLTLGIAMAQALHAAHRVGIIHRDVKPANILLDRHGTPLLADFGIASNLYRADTMTGYSPLWAAPEVAAHRSGGDESSDLYALGATLFALHTGMLPPFVEHVAPADDMSRDLMHVLDQAMAENPDDRFRRSAKIFAAAMEDVLRRHGVSSERSRMRTRVPTVASSTGTVVVRIPKRMARAGIPGGRSARRRGVMAHAIVPLAVVGATIMLACPTLWHGRSPPALPKVTTIVNADEIPAMDDDALRLQPDGTVTTP